MLEMIAAAFLVQAVPPVRAVGFYPRPLLTEERPRVHEDKGLAAATVFKKLADYLQLSNPQAAKALVLGHDPTIFGENFVAILRRVGLSAFGLAEVPPRYPYYAAGLYDETPFRGPQFALIFHVGRILYAQNLYCFVSEMHNLMHQKGLFVIRVAHESALDQLLRHFGFVRLPIESHGHAIYQKWGKRPPGEDRFVVPEAPPGVAEAHKRLLGAA